MDQTVRDDLEVMVRRAGLSLSETKMDEIHAAWMLVVPMLDRIRQDGRDRTVEPAQVFRADIYFQRRCSGTMTS